LKQIDDILDNIGEWQFFVDKNYEGGTPTRVMGWQNKTYF